MNSHRIVLVIYFSCDLRMIYALFYRRMKIDQFYNNFYREIQFLRDINTNVFIGIVQYDKYFIKKIEIYWTEIKATILSFSWRKTNTNKGSFLLLILQVKDRYNERSYRTNLSEWKRHDSTCLINWRAVRIILWQGLPLKRSVWIKNVQVQQVGNCSMVINYGSKTI